jgi:hypothetical protein
MVCGILTGISILGFTGTVQYIPTTVLLVPRVVFFRRGAAFGH